MKKKLYIIVITVVIAFMFAFAVKSKAETEDIIVLQERKKAIQNQIAENKVQIDELEIQISDLMRDIQELDNKIYKYEIEVAVLDIEIEELDIRVREVQDKYDKAEKNYELQKELLIDSIVAQYEAGETVYLDFLLNSNGLMEFISNYYFLSEIIEYNNELVEEYEEQKQKINTIKQELDEYKNEVKIKKDDEEKAAIVLANIQVVKNNQMTKLSSEEQLLQKKLEEYENEERKIEVELLVALTKNLGEAYVGGELAWPVPGYTTLSSKYGMRIHPIYGTYKLHTGIDIAAPSGVPFIAANDGEVITSRYTSSYGNVVVIDHGGGLSTLYAHGSERLVEEGDKVKRGEPVMLVGSTGVSTGPHAHFEVRVNGLWTDPLEYLLNKDSNVINIDENEDGIPDEESTNEE